MRASYASLRRLFSGLERRSPVAWRAFFVPPELINAARILPLAPERVLSTLAQAPCRHLQRLRHRAVTVVPELGCLALESLGDLTDIAEIAGFDRKTCSYVKGLYGLVKTGLIPHPALVVTSASYCMAMPALLRQLARDANSVHIHLDIPETSITESSVSYLASQMKTLANQLCRVSNIDVHEYEASLLPKAIVLSNDARREWLHIQDLRGEGATSLGQPSIMDLNLTLSDDWGLSLFVESLRGLKARMETALRSKPTSHPTLRLHWMHLRPYFDEEVFRLIEDHNAAIVSESVNTVLWEELDPDRPYESLARKAMALVQMSFFGRKFQEMLDAMLTRDRIDGIIYFFHENCEWAERTFPPIRQHLNQPRNGSRYVPIIALHAESLIPSAKNAVQTRLSAFLQGLQQARGMSPGRERPFPRSSVAHTRGFGSFFVGVDVGSTFVKAVIVNSCGQDLSHAKHRIGSDVKSTISGTITAVCERIDKCPGAWEGLVSTGVSQDAVEVADGKLSEILCHTKGIRKLAPQVTAIVEIGSQDVKGIDLLSGHAEQNDRCGAGIGNFLEEFASIVKISHRDLRCLYSVAPAGLEFPALCKAIIETEVRHAIGRNEELSRIVRGFYDALARIVVSSACARIPPKTRFLAVCGGAVMDGAFLLALKSVLAHLANEIYVPPRPMYTGALGAALYAIDLANGHEAPPCGSPGRANAGATIPIDHVSNRVPLS